ncbi:MAG: hypothetical protein AAF637_18410 [Pseudomonadota bacterium]
MVVRWWRVVSVFCLLWLPGAGLADWRSYTDDQGRATVGALDGSASVGLMLDCARLITLVTPDTFAPGASGLRGEYDNGLSFRVEARVPQHHPHTLDLVRADQIDALIRGLQNRHALALTDPNGKVYAFDLAGFASVWRAACGGVG